MKIPVLPFPLFPSRRAPQQDLRDRRCQRLCPLRVCGRQRVHCAGGVVQRSGAKAERPHQVRLHRRQHAAGAAARLAEPESDGRGEAEGLSWPARGEAAGDIAKEEDAKAAENNNSFSSRSTLLYRVEGNKFILPCGQFHAEWPSSPRQQHSGPHVHRVEYPSSSSSSRCGRGLLHVP